MAMDFIKDEGNLVFSTDLTKEQSNELLDESFGVSDGFTETTSVPEDGEILIESKKVVAPNGVLNDMPELSQYLMDADMYSIDQVQKFSKKKRDWK